MMRPLAWEADVSTSRAATAGALVGLLAGTAICLIQPILFSDAVFRVFILSLAGAWMAVLLYWLNQLLSPDQERQS